MALIAGSVAVEPYLRPVARVCLGEELTHIRDRGIILDEFVEDPVDRSIYLPYQRHHRVNVEVPHPAERPTEAYGRLRHNMELTVECDVGAGAAYAREPLSIEANSSG